MFETTNQFMYEHFSVVLFCISGIIWGHISVSLRSLRSDRDNQSDPRVPNGDAAETAER